MTTTISITRGISYLIEKQWERSTKEIGWMQKEGFIHALLLLAITDEKLVKQAAFLSRHYFDGKGSTAIEHNE